MPVIGLCQISSAHKNHEIFRGDTLSRLQARSKIYTKMIESSLVIINYKILFNIWNLLIGVNMGLDI